MKKLAKRVLIIILAVLVAVQAPFIYRRYKMGQIAARIQELNRTRTPSAAPKYKEYKGVIHAHTSLGGHSTGSFEELIAAANANDLDFVIMTEHWSDAYDTAALTLNGVYGKTLFIGGNEIDTSDSDRFLMIPGSADAAGLRKMSTPAVLDKLHAENRLALVTYPEKLKSWNANFDGIEVFSVHTNAKKMNPFTALFDAIWSFPKYPELMLATYFKRPDENLRRFDEVAANRDISLIAGTDAHSNIGFHFLGDDAGNRLLNIKIDPYERIFRLVREHVLIETGKPLTPENLIEAMRAGRFFVGFDVLGDTTGFTFEQCDADALCAHSPAAARIVLLRNGSAVHEASGNQLKYGPYDKGVYRVEVYLDQLGPPFDKMPWIISNPIYVR
jgi:hypothetical protein